jgi:SNF2 family DNA or RNA helicase
VVDRFNRGELRALVATDAGAEGLNLQERCHTVFNYDLHWNPMKMEQRIGRVHRLGQRHPVLVANFALADTIDEYVLDLLYQKIDLFTLTIGALETILADIQEGEMDVEERILDILLRDEESPGIRDGINQLGEDFERVRLARRQAESLTTDLLG